MDWNLDPPYQARLFGRADVEKARALHREIMGKDSERRRARQIARLPKRQYKRGTLYSLTCATGHGWGVPEDVLWHLIDLRHFACARHNAALLTKQC